MVVLISLTLYRYVASLVCKVYGLANSIAYLPASVSFIKQSHDEGNKCHMPRWLPPNLSGNTLQMSVNKLQTFFCESTNQLHLMSPPRHTHAACADNEVATVDVEPDNDGGLRLATRCRVASRRVASDINK